MTKQVFASYYILYIKNNCAILHVFVQVRPEKLRNFVTCVLLMAHQSACTKAPPSYRIDAAIFPVHQWPCWIHFETLKSIMKNSYMETTCRAN